MNKRVCFFCVGTGGHVLPVRNLIKELKDVPIENLTFGGKGLNLSYLLTNFIMISFVVLFFIFHLLIVIYLQSL